MRIFKLLFEVRSLLTLSFGLRIIVDSFVDLLEYQPMLAPVEYNFGNIISGQECKLFEEVWTVRIIKN